MHAITAFQRHPTALQRVVRDIDSRFSLASGREAQFPRSLALAHSVAVAILRRHQLLETGSSPKETKKAEETEKEEEESSVDLEQIVQQLDDFAREGGRPTPKWPWPEAFEAN